MGGNHKVFKRDGFSHFLEDGERGRGSNGREGASPSLYIMKPHCTLNRNGTKHIIYYYF